MKTHTNQKPVIVLGTDRSGSTNLMNLIRDNFNLAVPSHSLHYGFIENFLYSRYLLYGDLSDKEIYIKFVEEIYASDFIQSLQIEKEELYTLKIKNYFDFFLSIMDFYAKKNRFNHWATKLDPFIFLNKNDLNVFTETLMNRYGGFKLIYIHRNFDTYLPSYINLGGLNYESRSKSRVKRLGRAFSGSIGHKIFNTEFKEFATLYNGLELKFEDYVNNQEAVKQLIKKHIAYEIKNKPILFSKPNTSFQNKARINLTPTENIISKYVFHNRLFANTIGLFLLRKHFLRNVNNPTYYRILLSKKYPNYLINKLKSENDTMLVEYVNDNE